MTEKGMEKAAHVADMMQTIARLLVLVIIIPSAIWLTVFYLLGITEIIPDVVIRGLFSLTFGLGLAGILIARMRHPARGSMITVLAAVCGSLSLALFWSSIFVSFLILHVFLIVMLVIFKYLRSALSISHLKWMNIRSVLGIGIVVTAAFPTVFFGLSIQLSALSLTGLIGIVLWFYLICSQYLLQEPRFGVVTVVLPALTISLLQLGGQFTANPLSELPIIVSFLAVSFGVSLFVLSQVYRLIQNSLSRRPIKAHRKLSKKEYLLREIGIELESEKQATQQAPAEAPEWLIVRAHAQLLSGVSLLCASAGIPIFFLWRVASTSWSAESGLPVLFLPLAILLALLCSIPAPVFFRLGGAIRRSLESKVTKSLGLFVVVDATLGLYLWTQYYSWLIFLSYRLGQLSVPLSALLFITGITGLFKEIREIWRAAWTRIRYSLKRMLYWVKTHYIHAGAFADAVLTGTAVFILYPTLSQYPGFLLVVGSLSGILFTAIAMAGVAAIRQFPRRNTVLSLGTSCLIVSLSLLTFWYLSYIQQYEIMYAGAWSVTCFILVAGLQKLHVSRKAILPPFACGLLAFLLLMHSYETQSVGPSYFLLTIASALVLSSAILHREYGLVANAIGRVLINSVCRIARTLANAAHRMTAALRAIGSRVRLGLLRLWGIIYRGGVWVGVQIVRFVLVLYGGLLVLFIGQYGYGLLLVSPATDAPVILSWLALVFLTSFSPALILKGLSRSRAMSACIMLVALSFGAFVFGISSDLEISVRAPLAAFLSLAILTAARSRLNARVKTTIPYATWLMFVIWLSSNVYYSSVHLGTTVALFFPAFIAGLGALPLRVEHRLTKASSGLYLALSVPSGTLLTYIFFQDLLSCVVVILLLPSVVLYRQYSFVLKGIARGLLVAGSKMLVGLRIVGSWIRSALYRIASGLAMTAKWILMVLASHVIASTGAASFILSLFFLQYLMVVFYTLEYGVVIAAVAFVLLVDVFWLPSMAVRRENYPDLLSHSLVVLSASTGILTCLICLPFGCTSSLLLGVCFASMLFAMTAPFVRGIKSRTSPAVVTLAAILFLGLNLVVADTPVKLGLAVMGLSLLSAPLFSSTNRWRVAYPIVTCSFVGSVIYAFLFVPSELWFAVSLFVSVESLLLSLPKRTRTWQLWWAFSISAGGVLYLLLSVAPLVRLVLPALIVVELLRLTPEVKHRFADQSGLLNIVRAAFLATIAWIEFFPALITLLVFEITELVFLTVLAISVWRSISDPHQHALENAIALSLSAVIGTCLTGLWGIELILSVYPAVLPLFVSLVHSSFDREQNPAYWFSLRGTLVFLMSAAWYAVYRSVESLLLVIPTALLVSSLLSSWSRAEGFKQQGVSRVTCGSVVILLEAIWLWHAFFLLAASSSLTLLISSVLLFSVIIFPITKNISWLGFEMVWDAVSIAVSVSIGAYLTAWDVVSLVFPPDPLMTAGWSLSIFSVLSGLLVRYNEVSQGEVPTQRISHMAWLPSIPGWALLGFSYGSILNPIWTLGLTVLSASVASVIFALIHPNASNRIRAAANMMIASSLAYICWIWLGLPSSIESGIVTLGIWFIAAFPTLGPVVYAGLSKTYAFLRLHSDIIAIGVPVVIGACVGSIFLFQSSCPLLLGLNVRHCFQGLGTAAISIGLLYMVEGAFLNTQLSAQVRMPSAALVERGLPVLILGFYLPEALSNPALACYLILGALAVSFPIAAGINHVYGFKTAANRFWMAAGILLLPTSYLGMTIYDLYPPFTALVISIVLVFFMELPFLRSQVLSFVRLMGRLGRTISAVLRNLGAVLTRLARNIAHTIRLVFERFGYFNWVMFSLMFTIGLSYLSGSFFSELMGMNPSGLLYSVPTISMPVFILGMLLLTIAVVRRRVKSSFGVSCVVISLAGAALTSSSWLFDQGQQILAMCLGAILFCIGGISVLIEEGISGAKVSALWAPIPVSAAAVVFSFLIHSSTDYGAAPVASSVAAMVGSLILLLSAYSRLFPESARDPLWTITALSTGATAYLILLITHIPLLASFYFAVFVASWILYPVIFKISKYLFSSFLFFALTGFAFAFVFGEVYQGLLLALSSFLLFIALFIKEKERKRPRLAYLRLAVLLVLLGSLVVFGISVVSLFV